MKPRRSMALGTERLARASASRPWRTVTIWLVVLALAVVATTQLLSDALTTEVGFTDRPESEQALELIEEIKGKAADIEFVVVSAETSTVADADYVAYVTEVQNELAKSDAVKGVGSYLSQDGPVSESGRTALLPVVIAGESTDEISVNAGLVKETVVNIDVPDGFQTLVAGQASLDSDFDRIAEEDLRTGETIGIGVALLVLVLVFGTIASGVIPIILAMVAIAIAIGMAALVGQVFDLSFFVTSMITMIGLAVGIDYSLFIVSRYREERARVTDKVEAIGRAGATATRAVFFSGLTVVLSLVGLVILPNTLFRALGTGAILVVVVAVAASLTLLPAVLSLMGDRIDSLKVRRRDSNENRGRVWERVTRVVMGRPVASLLGSVLILLVAASSFLSIETGMAGVSSLPDDIESKQAFEILMTEFSGGLTSPVDVVVKGDGADQTAIALTEAIAADGRFGPSAIDPVSSDQVAILSVQLLGDVDSLESMDAVRHLRDDIVPAISTPGGAATVLVGGRTANTVDFLDQTDKYTPVIFAIVLGLSFILLTLAFRSVVIPAKAIAMNLLSVSAAYGLVVAFFQSGVGPSWVKEIAEFFGFGQVEAIDAWLPLIMFSILFGLSMDYHVFLLSRIKERFDHTGDNTESVAYGLRNTGALITGAAIIMVAVFAGFASGRLTAFQQMGFGLAVAVLLDATIVRSILVPASMKLLGSWNWYFPSWLEWVPNISVEGSGADVVTERSHQQRRDRDDELQDPRLLRPEDSGLAAAMTDGSHVVRRPVAEQPIHLAPGRGTRPISQNTSTVEVRHLIR